jgi:hypothetical protein
MSRCEKCCLRLNGESFTPDLLRKIPLHLRRIFVCDNETFIENHNSHLPLNKSICPADLWVLTFIGCNDRFAVKNAENTLDNLVKTGASELLCNLFENAPYEVRRNLWLRMIEKHSHRLYLFDTMFEKDCLPPFETDSQNRHFYQYSILMRNSASPALFDDL